ncbi:MAG: SHOCT domain-containing protein [Candidatus Nanopelagicales bacterium]
MSIAEFLWYALMVFAFVAYLFILFFILTDLFRDHKLSGWWKAIWILFLVFFPFITALVYLIFRGKGMGERAQQAQSDAIAAQNAYIKQVAGTTTPADQISGAKALLDQGAITQEEFDKIKAQALGS